MVFTEFGDESSVLGPKDPRFAEFLQYTKRVADLTETSYISVAKDEEGKMEKVEESKKSAKGFKAPPAEAEAGAGTGAATPKAAPKAPSAQVTAVS